VYHDGIMDTVLNPDLANELRYALGVMEEYSHLGLDEEYASTLREILERRIADADAAVSFRPAQPVRFSISSKVPA
jgi:hypothetical protein